MPASAALPDAAPVAFLRLARSPALESGGARVALPLLDAALLAWLALEGPTPRARLAALLWPGSGTEAARNSLRQRLFKLRRSCGLELVTGSATLALAAGVAHDLDEADGVLADEAPEVGGEFDDWLERQRARRRDRVRQSLVELCTMAEQAGDWADAIGHAEELLALAPLSEEAHRRLMRLHYLAGDRSAAMLAFDRCERVLKDEVGARPSAETLALLRTVELARTALPAVVAAPRVPAAVLRPPRLVGRDDAWAALREAWDGGQAAFVTGEGGLGKSRLAGDFGAAQGRVVVAGARPGDERVAYASFSRLLRALPRATWATLSAPARCELARLLPELGEAPAPAGDAGRARFFNAVAALFAPDAGHVDGVVFDDLHFADEASIELLQYVVGASPCHWIVTARADEVPPAGRRWLDEALARPEPCHVPLAPLTLAQVAELVDSLQIAGLDGAAVAPALRQRSGGNPLVLLETLKAGFHGGDVAGAARLPAVAGLHRLVERRIARLSMPAVHLARCAAIAAPDFSIELAAHVLALRTIDLADPWAELEAAQVLVDGGAFAHDLIHEAALASVPAPVARQLHAEVAAFLAARGGEPARLARHWSHAGRWPEAGDAFLAAAARARDAARTLEQAGLLNEAAACFERAGEGEARFDALAQRARVLGDNVLGADARAAVDELAALARSPAQQLQAIELRLLLSMGRAEVHETLDIGREGLAAARGLGRADLELRFAIAVADALCDLRRGAEAVALLEGYGELAREHADVGTRWDYWHSLGMALDYADRLREALPAWEAGRQVAQRAGRGDMVWKTMSSSAATLAKMGFVRRSAQQYEQACRVALAADELTLRVQQMRVTWAHRLRDLGRYDEALALLEEALAAFATEGGAADGAGTEHRLAQLYQQLGQPARAAQLLAADRPGLAPGLAMMRLVHRADVAHQLGRDGLPAMREALAVIDNPDDIYHRIASLFATRLVPADEGEALATSLAAWASARERLGVALAGHVRAAACALAQGAPMRARPHADAALHLAQEREPDSFYLPELWLVAGQVEAALGAPARAAERWRDGAAWVMRTADAHVPAPFRDSFLHRNAVNAELLARASTA